MKDTILRRARVVTLVLAAGLSIVFGLRVSWRFGLGVMASAAWATLGFWLLEGLLRRALVPPGARRPTRAIFALAGGKVLLYGIAVWALLARPLPVMSYLIGFSLLLIAVVAVGALTRRHAPPGPPQSRGHDA